MPKRIQVDLPYSIKHTGAEETRKRGVKGDRGQCKRYDFYRCAVIQWRQADQTILPFATAHLQVDHARF
jgi:hypothetical protein